MRKVLKICLASFALMVFLGSFGIVTYASSYTFGADMQNRMVNGKTNKVTYAIGSGVTVTVSGNIGAYSYNSKDCETVKGNPVAPQTTYVGLYETVKSKAVLICEGSATADVLNKVKTFTCSGKTTSNSAKYIIIYKVFDDGYNVSINGTITY